MSSRYVSRREWLRSLKVGDRVVERETTTEGTWSRVTEITAVRQNCVVVFGDRYGKSTGREIRSPNHARSPKSPRMIFELTQDLELTMKAEKARLIISRLFDDPRISPYGWICAAKMLEDSVREKNLE